MRAGVKTVEIVGEACRQYSKSPLWAGLLFRLVRAYRPAVCIELGTCLGVASVGRTDGLGGPFRVQGGPPLAFLAGRRGVQALVRRLSR